MHSKSRIIDDFEVNLRNRNYVKSAALDFSVVVMEVASNWGAEKTCIYRMRVHGEEVTAGASH